MSAPPRHRRQRTSPRQREREIVDATRALFDERGMQDAQVEDIANAVGINKALIYRHFQSKEELFILTMTRYLEELAQRIASMDDDADPLTRLRAFSATFADFCLEYPAFLDCAISLMRRPAAELREQTSDAVWIRIGQHMVACLEPLSRLLAAGREQGVFHGEDPEFMANQLWAAALGAMHLARLGIGVRSAAPGVPAVFPVDAERVREAWVDTAVAVVTGAPTTV